MIAAIQLAVIVACVVSAAFFAGMETGAISIHRMRLRHFVRQGARGARTLQWFLTHSDRLLGTTLVGTNVSTVVASILATSLAVQWAGAWGETVSTVVVSILMLLFGEYLPKDWFHRRPLERCRRFAGLLSLAEVLFRPVSKSVVWFTHWLVPGSPEAFAKAVPFVTREDLKILAREGEKDGVLSPRERVMIHRVFELSGKRAREIIVPREEMTVVNSAMPVGEFYQTAKESGFTRMPVYDKERERFAGIINVFDALSSRHAENSKTVADFQRPPLLVQQDMPVDEILPRMRRARQPMCLVVDEKEDVIGLITTEDILEEIVGKLSH